MTCLNNIDVADEDHLEWEQVLEFRKDDNARGKLKRLFHWFNSSFVGKSQDYIQYEVSKLLQDYQVSLEIHGIKTKKGVIKSVLDSKNLLLTIGSSAIAGTIIGDLPALFTAVGTLVGNCTISIMESIIEKKEYQNQNVEIAFIHELKEKFSN